MPALREVETEGSQQPVQLTAWWVYRLYATNLGRRVLIRVGV
jgi:hypothetical protein